MAKRIILFLIINFAGLGLGSLFTDVGVDSTWYQSLEKAPWTPPGWVFGAAWTLIMICFSIYLAFAYKSYTNKSQFFAWFALVWILNFVWNPLFFTYHFVLVALIVISLLTLFIVALMIDGWSKLKVKSILLLPYVLWLIIATSLNAYIYIQN